MYPLIFIYALVIVSPKQELFYFAEEFLEKEKLVISNEKISDLGLFFKIQNATLFYDSIQAGNARELSTLFTLFYNRVSLSNFEIHSDFKDFFPGNIEKIEAKHIFYQPHIIEISGEGAFGSLSGDVNLIERKIRVVLKVSSVMSRKYRQLLRGFKKSKEGYVYEQKF